MAVFVCVKNDWKITISIHADLLLNTLENNAILVTNNE